MRLFGRGRKTRARSFTHYYRGRLPAPLTDEVLKLELVKRLQGGDRSVISQIIEGHLALGAQTVGYYCEELRSTIQSDDLMSVMSEAVTVAVNRVADGVAVENITGLILSTIHTMISDYLDRDRVMYIPGRTRRRKKAAGEAVRDPILTDLGALESVKRRSVFRRDVADPLSREDHTFQELEVREIIERICLNQQERDVLRLRMEGHTDVEVGSQLGLTKWSVYVIRKGLMARASNDFPNQKV